MKQIFFFFFIFILSNSYLQHCPPSYFYDIQHCQKCKDNCMCTIQNTCSSCIDGYTLFKNQCIQCPQSSGIYGECSGCCSREVGTILACTDCSLVPGMYSFLFSGRCILSDGCFQVDSNGFCTQCRKGYYEANNLCYSCQQNCSTCSDASNCLTCADGYYWAVNHGGLCTACPDGCSTCDQKGQCFSCLKYYYQYDNHCLHCPTNCDQCLDGSTCTSCSIGILVSNLCIQCNDPTYGGSTGCLKCSQNNNFIKCQQCDDSYFLDSSTGVCRSCQSFIVGAQRCRDQNTPTQCINDYDLVLENRYYLVGITCVPNHKKCKKISDVQGNCATCYQKYILNSNKQCELCPFTGCKISQSTLTTNECKCTTCDTGYYLPSMSFTCSVCSITNCAQCPNNVCSKCLSGYYLNTGNCVIVPTIVPFCITMSTNTNCQICQDGYYLGSDFKCYACQVNCLICSSRFVCSKCATGYYVDSGNFCVKMPNNCHEYDTAAFKCTLCNHGFYLQNGYCLQCSVQKGTLSLCQGLCPIDYYIQQLLSIKAVYEVHLTQFIILSLLLVSLFL